MQDHRDPAIARAVDTDMLAQQPDLLDGYPHRYVLLQATFLPGRTSMYATATARLLWAVELLETRGWELAGWRTVHYDQSATVEGAYMRRQAGASPGEPPA